MAPLGGIMGHARASAKIAFADMRSSGVLGCWSVLRIIFTSRRSAAMDRRTMSGYLVLSRDSLAQLAATSTQIFGLVSTATSRTRLPEAIE
jgi:hypothetical protein